ncbi:hypothetical protein ANN_20514 [Periplaneta americana]|uniref:Uncharacterized protein n=1 Tax=Periplaneta americana TaxID=6978 RepID=A0ABQ8SCT5_PERAM|nr:hypothetical protein ANN_20514 [Periplaneta americana]
MSMNTAVMLLPADPELRSDTGSIPAGADYLVGFFRGFPQPLISVDEIGDSEMIFDDMRPRIRLAFTLRLGKTSEKTQPADYNVAKVATLSLNQLSKVIRYCIQNATKIYEIRYHRTPVVEGGSKRCFRFLIVDPKSESPSFTTIQNNRYGHTSLLLQRCSTKNCATLVLRRVNNGATRKVAAAEPAARYFSMLRAA